MDTQKVTEEYRMSQWTQIMQTKNDSGKTIKDFCKATGISRNAYFYWQKKLREAACKELAKTTDSQENIVPGVDEAGAQKGSVH